MSKKKHSSPKSSPKAAPRQADTAGRNKMLVMVGLIAAVFVVATVAANVARPKSAGIDGKPIAAGTAEQGGIGVPPTIPAEEQKYLGRLLPANYQAPTVQPVTYGGTTQMTDVLADSTGAQVTVPLADLTTDKIVYFEYAKQGGDSVPMVAYVRPSGKLFVGVSYCIPCKGKRQFVDADGTLTCSSCGTKRDLETGVGISGACKLYPLDEVASKIVGDKLVIEKSVLDQWTPQPLDRKVG